MTAKKLILKRLSASPRALAVHELDIIGVSENAAATRLSELAREGRVYGARRPGKAFKEWRIYRGFDSAGQRGMDLEAA